MPISKAQKLGQFLYLRVMVTLVGGQSHEDPMIKEKRPISDTVGRGRGEPPCDRWLDPCFSEGILQIVCTINIIIVYCCSKFCNSGLQ